MNTQLLKTIKNLDTSSIPEERKKILNVLTDYLQEKVNKKELISINYICTHNSRRSHLGQIWMQALANYFNLNHITTYSGGTEATAMAKPIVKTLKSQGFEIDALSDGKNPIYYIKYNENKTPIIGFSKEYFHSFNPKNGFAAIMTCSQADEGCPFVAGTEKRIPITYEDPKEFDGTDLEADKYTERSIQIATETYYILKQLNL